MKPRAHVVFPSVTEARRKPSDIYSDHLLLLAKVKLNDKKETITLLTLNVLGPNASMCGFYPEGGWEKEVDTLSRYTRIAESLGKCVKENHVDVIALQETSPKHLVPFLRRQLKNGWEIIANDQTGLITCYSTQRFKCVPDKDIHHDTLNRVAHLKLHDMTDQADMMVCNVWGVYDPFPQKTEALFTSILNQAPNTILIGDTNSRIAPIDNEPKNITTAIVPLLINKRERLDVDLQRSDFPDGGFYRGADDVIHQLTTSVVDFKTGMIVNELTMAAAAQEPSEYRMILCLDDHYTSCPVIDGKTLAAYQESLNQHAKEKIDVRMAADYCNRKAVAMCFAPSSNLCQYIVGALSDHPGFKHQRIAEANESGRSFPVVFMSLGHLDDLVKVVNGYDPQKKHVQTGGMKLFDQGKAKKEGGGRKLPSMGQGNKRFF